MKDILKEFFSLFPDRRNLFFRETLLFGNRGPIFLRLLFLRCRTVLFCLHEVFRERSVLIAALIFAAIPAAIRTTIIISGAPARIIFIAPIIAPSIAAVSALLIAGISVLCVCGVSLLFVLVTLMHRSAGIPADRGDIFRAFLFVCRIRLRSIKRRI